MKAIKQSKTVAMAFAAAVLLPSVVNAEIMVTPSVSYALYEYKPAAGTSYDGGLGSLNIELEMEDRMGNFHRAWLSRSLYDDVQGMDLTQQQAVYRIGKYHYPKAEPTDLSMWTGVGYWEMEWEHKASGADGEDTYLYLPFGMEYAMPLDNRGAWPNGFAAQRNHFHFLVLGAEVNWLIHGEGKNSAWRESSGYGYRLWAGYDYRMSPTRILATSVEYQAWDVDGIGKTGIWNFTAGFRFL